MMKLYDELKVVMEIIQQQMVEAKSLGLRLGCLRAHWLKGEVRIDGT